MPDDERVLAQLKQLEARVATCEAWLADLRRGPAPRLASRGATCEEILGSLDRRGFNGGWETSTGETYEWDQKKESMLSASLWAVQVLAREVDTLREVVEDALHRPGGRAHPN